MVSSPSSLSPLLACLTLSLFMGDRGEGEKTFASPSPPLLLVVPALRLRSPKASSPPFSFARPPARRGGKVGGGGGGEKERRVWGRGRRRWRSGRPHSAFFFRFHATAASPPPPFTHLGLRPKGGRDRPFAFGERTDGERESYGEEEGKGAKAVKVSPPPSLQA